MLFPGLQGQPVGGSAHVVDRDTDQTAGQLPAQFLGHGHVTGVRATESERHTEALGGTDRDVGAHVTRAAQQGQGQDVGRHHGQGTTLVSGGDDPARVTDLSARGGVLHQDTEDVAVGQFLGQVGHHDLDVEGFGAGTQNLQSLGEDVGVHEEDVALGLGGTAGQGHPLGRGGGLVQQGRPRHR